MCIDLHTGNDYYSPMKDLPTRETIVRYSLLAATEKHLIQSIADEIGCSRGTLSPFLNGGNMGDALIDAGEKFARKSGYWLPDIFGVSPEDVWLSAASDLEHLSQVLLSPTFSFDEKMQRFARILNFYQGHLKTIAAEDHGEP
jgi:hypothetical protein